jgi:threonyl-tRNA synthetase
VQRVHSGRRAHLRRRQSRSKRKPRTSCNFIFEMYRDFGFDEFTELNCPLDPNQVSEADEVWDQAPRAALCQRAEFNMGVEVSKSIPVTARSTALRLTSTSRTRSAERGSAEPCNATSPCRRASIWNTSAAMDGRHTPVMIHRALLGSMERFIGILIETLRGRSAAVVVARADSESCPSPTRRLSMRRNVTAE